MKTGRHLTDAEVRQRIADAVTALVIEGKPATIGKILGRCSGASRSRYRTALHLLLSRGELIERGGR